MSQIRDPGGAGGEPRDSRDDAVARLLRLAGPRPAVPGAVTERVRTAAHAHWRATVLAQRRRRFITRALIPVAAAASLAVALALLRWPPIGSPRVGDTAVATLVRVDGEMRRPSGAGARIGEPLASGAELETGESGRAALRLASGHSVRLDTDTRLRVLSPSVLILSHGAVYVDSWGSPGAAQRIEVRTRLGVVRDIGTRFEVRVLERGLRLRVREGAASLERDGRSHPALEGVQLTVGEDGGVTAREVPVYGPEWDWILRVTPPFELEGSTLRDYLDWLAGETGLRVRLADRAVEDEASTVILHGSVEGLRPDETPSAVLPTCGLRHRVVGDLLVIERQ
ncbi:MAG: FecR family protein [Acidobacteriota bacterium]